MAKKPVITKYNITASKLKGGLTIALVSDIHERVDKNLAALVRETKPDIIAVAGDTLERFSVDIEKERENKKRGFVWNIFFTAAYYLNKLFKTLNVKNRPSTEKTYEFLGEISEIAPVYLSVGNHESIFLEEDKRLFEKLKITALDNSDTEVIFNGDKLVIGELSTFFDEGWLKEYSEKDGYKILLSHHPIYYDTLIKDKDIDLTLAGHNHGGQIRIKNKGLFSSGEGIFPKYDKGVFDSRLIVSAGCANTVALPRLNNPREIVKISINK